MNFFNQNQSDHEKTIYLERFVNNGSPSGFTQINNTSVGTRSFDNQEYISLSLIKIANTEIQNFGIDAGMLNCDEVLIHPDMKEYVLNNSNSTEICKINAIPLASGRTVFVPNYNCYVKLDYNKLLGRIERKIKVKNANHAIQINNIFHSIKMNDQHHFFAENFARIATLSDGNTVGMLLRDYEMYPKIALPYIVIPAFSLFSSDINNKFDESILKQLYDASNYSDIGNYVFDKFISPAISIYFETLIKTGLHIEAHAQNICYCYKNDIEGIIVRDFESMDKDLGIGEQYNNLFDRTYKCFDKNFSDYKKRHSFMFDYKLGEYLITPLIECAEKYGASKKTLEIKTKNLSLEYISNLPKDYYPSDKWYSLPKTLIDRRTSSRPYIENKSPKYR